jgi:hypothetical protein
MQDERTPMDDYTTRTRPELLALCKARGLSGAGTTDDLIERLRAQDAEASPADQDEDPLAEDATEDVPDPVSESGPPPAPAATPPAETAPPAAQLRVTDRRSDNETKAGDVHASGPDVRVKEGVTGNVFRFEFYADRAVDDELHRHFIAECHHNARAAGYATKGYPNAGHRVRVDQDAAGKPTVVYEVYLASNKPNGLRRP